MRTQRTSATKTQRRLFRSFRFKTTELKKLSKKHRGRLVWSSFLNGVNPIIIGGFKGACLRHDKSTYKLNTNSGRYQCEKIRLHCNSLLFSSNSPTKKRGQNLVFVYSVIRFDSSETLVYKILLEKKFNYRNCQIKQSQTQYLKQNTIQVYQKTQRLQ